MIFVDTSVWFAANVADDPAHAASRSLLLGASGDLVTTDYVVDELLTLMVMRRQREAALRTGPRFWSEAACKLVWTSRVDVEAAWQLFASFDDKTWGFTDCVSYAVMKRLGINEAYALDEHFRQFGFATVRP
jgi:predicted nucleic acid-binding protein